MAGNGVVKAGLLRASQLSWLVCPVGLLDLRYLISCWHHPRDHWTRLVCWTHLCGEAERIYANKNKCSLPPRAQPDRHAAHSHGHLSNLY